MKKLMSGVVAIALAVPLTVSTAMAAYEQEWKPMKPWFHIAVHPAGVYHNGYPGSAKPRTGYREYQGWWVPASTAAVIGPVDSALRVSSAHAEWCRNHDVSYRVSDDTYQPGRGDRRACMSPF